MQEKFITEKRLLVAEDNSINLLVLSRFLETFGYGFDAVGNGLDCLNLINENFYDLVLTDISMPEMDGLQLATEIRAMTDAKRDIPIIAMTANAETEAAERFVKAGINEVLAKPFDKTELKYCIERWL
ncbi:MAG: response regulator [Planktotalea sp.]|jgi:CheY-like chemotaxis protein|uniref:response regulator n=1 Tax=Planktotalea sp. TaxID=2029877 RepID=UPI0001839FE6|nr:response regulator [Planktotalea sp.]EDZ42050.1 transcriptional regulator [Rhodobacteraceae bacterium HTCC2083]MBT3465778.1 response regulator [Paracoccaceae bacterium]MDG1078458.1 response regulator [Planktotalea sp.]MDG1083775.1 response regulator [Planktotalea sp.]HCW84735.1 response regulator [Paracoccaceae bacterium]